MYVVYGLTNPLTREGFYVGMTKDLYERYTQHLKGEGNNKNKNEIIESLKKVQLVPEIMTLARAETEQEAKRLEAFHTDCMRITKQPLTNQTLWTGYVPTKDEKEHLDTLIKWVHTRSYPKSKLGRWLDNLLTPYIIGPHFFRMYFHNSGKEAL